MPLPRDADDLASVTRDFHERHRLAYGHAHPDGEVELVNVRIAAYGVVDKPEPPPYRSGTNRVEDAVIEERDVWLLGAPVRCPVYEHDRLPESAIVAGPAVVEEFGATTVVFPRWCAELDRLGNLNLQRKNDS